MALLNSTYALGSHFDDPSLLISDIIAADEADQTPIMPIMGDTALLYRHATISLSFDPSYISPYPQPVNVNADVTIFDLGTGLPVTDVTFVDNGAGGVFQASLSFGNGIWGGSLRGGAMFALGLMNNGSLSSTSPSNYTSALNTSSTPISVSPSLTSTLGNYYTSLSNSSTSVANSSFP